jgi:hypothetical protein
VSSVRHLFYVLIDGTKWPFLYFYYYYFFVNRVSIKCLVFGKSAVNQTSSVKYSILLTDGSGTIKAEGWGQPGLAFFESVIVSN